MIFCCSCYYDFYYSYSITTYVITVILFLSFLPHSFYNILVVILTSVVIHIHILILNITMDCCS